MITLSCSSYSELLLTWRSLGTLWESCFLTFLVHSTPSSLCSYRKRWSTRGRPTYLTMDNGLSLWGLMTVSLTCWHRSPAGNGFGAVPLTIYTAPTILSPVITKSSLTTLPTWAWSEMGMTESTDNWHRSFWTGASKTSSRSMRGQPKNWWWSFAGILIPIDSDRLLHPMCLKEQYCRSFFPAAVNLYNLWCSQ